jgi:hypothetical protein
MNDHRERRLSMAAALNHLQSAIALLDQAEAPGHIAAQLDLARHQLESELGLSSTSGPFDSDFDDAQPATGPS